MHRVVYVNTYERYQQGLPERQGTIAPVDVRSPAQRDRDRLLYAPSFQRLAQITQVVSPSEGRVVHNRLTHTLKVAQLARRIAEGLLARYPQAAKRHSIDPDVAESAALAHDLGHPPFGHVAEDELQNLLKQDERAQGISFEGNAQSFRIITVLEEHPGADSGGLDLTRATLDAVLKYPWMDDPSALNPKKKWGAYRSESAFMQFARKGHQGDDDRRCIEAEIMDLADDIAYCVHDLDDFFRAGLIPLDRLADSRSHERGEFLNRVVEWFGREQPNLYKRESALRLAFDQLIDRVPFDEPFDDSSQARMRLRNFSSGLITRYLSALELGPRSASEDALCLPSDLRDEIHMLKQLTRQYVISHPSLATIQHGQRVVIRQLYNAYTESALGNLALFPRAWHSRLKSQDIDVANRIRLAVDFIAGLTEGQAIQLAGCLAGTSHQLIITNLIP